MSSNGQRLSRGSGAAASTLQLGNVRGRLEDAPNCRVFVDAWERWRGDKLVPTRADIRPEMLGLAMQAITVMEVEAPDRIVIRLVSMNYELLVGRPAKGGNYIDMAAPGDRQRRVERHQNIIDRPCGALARGRVVPANGLAVVTRNLILPVAAGPDGPIAFVYNCADFEHDRLLEPGDIYDLAPLADAFDYIDIGAGLPC